MHDDELSGCQGLEVDQGGVCMEWLEQPGPCPVRGAELRGHEGWLPAL